MIINPVRTATNYQVKHDKDNSQVTQDSKNPTEAESTDNDEQVKFSLEPNQKLIIGAKALMVSLNKQLSLGDRLTFDTYNKESAALKDTQPVQLDKIAIEPFQFDFEQVAKNVMDFVSGTILNAKAAGTSDEKLNTMLHQARSGVDKGFSMAREELKGFDLFTPDIAEGIDKSYELINHSIDELEQQIFYSDNDKVTVTANSNTSLNKTLNRFDSLEQEQGRISLTTQGGDRINVHFDSIASPSQQQQNNDGLVNHQIQFNENQFISFQIEGNLDKQESKEVSGLIKDISKLADNFFGDNIEKSWQQAADLGFDDKQIAKFSFDFKGIKQIAMVEYSSHTSNQADSPIATIAPYLKDLASLVNRAESLFNGDNLQQLMNSVVTGQRDVLGEVVEKKEQNFVDFNQRIIETLK